MGKPCPFDGQKTVDESLELRLKYSSGSTPGNFNLNITEID